MKNDFANLTFEQLLTQLSSIVEALESGTLSLEEAVEKYQQGIALSAECKKRLDAAKEVVISKMTPSGEVPLK